MDKSYITIEDSDDDEIPSSKQKQKKQNRINDHITRNDAPSCGKNSAASNRRGKGRGTNLSKNAGFHSRIAKKNNYIQQQGNMS